VKVISDQLGHASVSFTLERYSHVLPGVQDEAAAKVERMLNGLARFALAHRGYMAHLPNRPGAPSIEMRRGHTRIGEA
jgi:hypothetical protein